MPIVRSRSARATSEEAPGLAGCLRAYQRARRLAPRRSRYPDREPQELVVTPSQIRLSDVLGGREELDYVIKAHFGAAMEGARYRLGTGAGV
jgi:hypothetical protein